ncbi:MAG TPA: hypothetical protein VIJ93_09375 [bacterium]
MQRFLILTLAALLEAGGDALMRMGLKQGRLIGFVLGAIALIGYGLVVNLPDWGFGRLLGIYLCLFFIISQVLAVLVFHETLGAPRLWAGGLILIAGLILTFSSKS